MIVNFKLLICLLIFAQVIVTHVKTINDFYVTPKDLISKRTSIMNALNISEFSAYPIDKWLETNYVCIARRQGEW